MHRNGGVQRGPSVDDGRCQPAIDVLCFWAMWRWLWLFVLTCSCAAPPRARSGYAPAALLVELDAQGHIDFDGARLSDSAELTRLAKHAYDSERGAVRAYVFADVPTSKEAIAQAVDALSSVGFRDTEVVVLDRTTPIPPPLRRDAPAAPPQDGKVQMPIWPCGFPARTTADSGFARIRVAVDAEGHAKNVTVEHASSPEFGRAAVACAVTRTFLPGRDEAGAPRAGGTPPITVQFVR